MIKLVLILPLFSMFSCTKDDDDMKCKLLRVQVASTEFVHKKFQQSKSINLFEVLGKGGSGNVLAGELDGKRVAVKSAKNILPGKLNPIAKLKKTAENLMLFNRMKIVKEPLLLFRGKVSGGGVVEVVEGLNKRFDTTLAEIPILAMTRLGPDLKKLCLPGKGVSVCTQLDALRIGKEILKKLKKLHQAGYYYADGKPDNFVVGDIEEGKEGEIFLIDFERAGKVAEVPANHNPGGDPRMWSRNCHKRMPSYGDDVESLAYSMLLLANGQLPWSKSEDEDFILERKTKLSPAKIAGKIHPTFAEFLTISKKSSDDYGKLPDYNALFAVLARGIADIAKTNGLDGKKLKFSWQKSKAIKKVDKMKTAKDTKTTTPSTKKDKKKILSAPPAVTAAAKSSQKSTKQLPPKSTHRKEAKEVISTTNHSVQTKGKK